MPRRTRQPQLTTCSACGSKRNATEPRCLNSTCWKSNFNPIKPEHHVRPDDVELYGDKAGQIQQDRANEDVPVSTTKSVLLNNLIDIAVVKMAI